MINLQRHDNLCPGSISDDLEIKPALHSISGAELIKREFPLFATESIISAVYNHTVGSPDMDLFSQIIFISDYIEPGRVYPYSIELRNFFFDGLKECCDDNSKLKLLHSVIFKILSRTISYLNNHSKKVHPRSLLTKNRFSSLI